MPKTNKILVPLDFSPCSENALIYAINLATKLNLEIEVLHVATYDTPALDYPSFVAIAMERKVETSRSLMKRLIEKLKKEFGEERIEKMELEVNYELGLPIDKIVKTAKTHKVDFIVMGTQGENSFWDKFLGSVASQVVKEAPCPVMVIPQEAVFEEKIVMGYATNFLEADVYEIWRATRLLQDFQAEIKCIHLNKKQNFIIKRIEELEAYFAENAPDLKISFYSLYPKNMVDDLNGFIERKEINMMVMYKPKRSFFESIFHQSFTQNMALHVEIPLLVLNT